jgi:serine/threonine protein kinase/Tol biopolymer transport system component
MIGTTAGHYEILEKLGEGGMGVVYKARDVLLNRVAALKFLPTDGAPDDRRSRFIKEAQSASALNHPNIITIYEVAKAADRDFIAMELVQGQTLDQLIGRKGLPLARVLAYATQIADALAAAHAAGIVHRDLKPANVMVTDTGLIKVLDFGLAKLMPAAWTTDATQTLEAAPTTGTAGGLIVGTVAYMSPEQAEGKLVDHRSDIFSFGALLHEMLTGRRAFQGESAASTLAAILTAEPPPLSGELRGAPPELVRIVSRCLRKLPEKRWQSLADVRIALEELQQDLESGRPGPSSSFPPPPTRRSWMPAAAAALVATAVTGFVMWRGRPSPPVPEIWQISRLTGDAGLSLNPAISRDGKLVTYVSDRAGSDTMDLWVQQIEGGDPVQLTRGLGACRETDFSPDGATIAVQCGGDPAGIYIMPTLGGLPKRIGEGTWPRFSPDGSQISFVTLAVKPGAPPTIKIAPVNGGPATTLEPGKGLTSAPIWRPDGAGLLFVGLNDPQTAGQNRFDWYFLPAGGGPVASTGAIERLRAADFGPGNNLAVTQGGVLFSHGNSESSNIYELPFDASFTRVTGAPIPIVVGAGLNFSPTASQDGARIAFAIGNNLSTNIWRAAVDPKTGAVAGAPVRVTSGVDPSLVPSPSRDGKRLAYLGSSRKSPEVRIRDLESGTDLRLAGAKEWTYLTLAPDGSTVAFSSDLRIGSAVYVVSSSGGVPRQVCATCGRPIEWLTDRTRLLIDGAGENQREIHILDVNTGRTTPLLRHGEFQLTMPRLSPDGRVLAFTQVRRGRERRIYLAPFPAGNNEALIPEQQWSVVVQSSDLDRQPAWGPEGSTLYFLSERDGSRCIWAQRVDTGTRQPLGDAFAAHHMHQVRYSLGPVDVASIGLSLASGQLFYASSDVQSNIWLAERRPVRR